MCVGEGHENRVPIALPLTIHDSHSCRSAAFQSKSFSSMRWTRVRLEYVKWGVQKKSRPVYFVHGVRIYVEHALTSPGVGLLSDAWRMVGDQGMGSESSEHFAGSRDEELLWMYGVMDQGEAGVCEVGCSEKE